MNVNKTSLHFSIIIPWKSGDPVREKSLLNMLNCLVVQDTPASKECIIYEVIVVEQVTAENKGKWEAKTKNIVSELITDFKYIQLINDNKFNKSWCMNIGARAAKYPHLLFMDADSLFGKDFFITIKHQLRATPTPSNKIMFCWNYIICLIGKDNPVGRHIRPDMTCAMGGIWYCEKDFYFNKLGGMNENYFGYGGEDNDVYERACFVLNKTSISYMPYPLAHQYHDWVKPDENCTKYLDITKSRTSTVIERLKEVNHGNKTAPTLIQLEDLQ